MKKMAATIMTLSFLALLSGAAWGQLFVENFDYPTGRLDGTGGWVKHSGQSHNVVSIVSPGLTYAGYSGSGIGNAVQVDSSGDDVHHTFTSQSSGTIYVSFLCRVDSASTNSNRYFLHLMNSGDFNAHFGRVFAKNDGSDNIAFGVSKAGIAGQISSFTYSLNTVYLLVLKYEFTAGADNDRASLFVFSSGVPSSEPGTPTVTAGAGGTDPTSLDAIALRQGDISAPGNNSGYIIDGIRVGLTWGDSPLPVQLSSFSASAGDERVTLNWATESELQNLGFDLMRAFERNGEYSTIGFVEGRFNSNERTEYEFIDEAVENGTTYWYKLVDIDALGVRTEHGPVSATPQKATVAGTFELYPAFPNPFNPSTTLQYEVPASQDGLTPVKIEIYNMLGQKIKTLLDDRVEAGQHVVSWDGTSEYGEIVPAGTYFGVLKSVTTQRVVKLVFLK